MRRVSLAHSLVCRLKKKSQATWALLVGIVVLFVHVYLTVAVIPASPPASPVEGGDASLREARRALSRILTRRTVTRSIQNVTRSGNNRILLITNGTAQVVGEEREFWKSCPNLQSWMRCEYRESTLENGVWNRSEAAIFRPFHIARPNPVWKQRHLDQKWIFNEHESPMKTWTAKRRSEIDIWTQFNVTVTYNTDAHVQHYMYAFECHPDPNKSPQQADFLQNKIGEVLWIASNCEWTMGREVYVEEMKKHIDVTVMGNCGSGEICGAYDELNIRCVNRIMRRYKFYLAFENSMCEDYYTEKVRKTLLVDTVPVVMGLANYTAILGAGTFIDVRDFTSVKELATHLRKVGSNPMLYNQLISRRTELSCYKTYAKSFMCDLCRYLHEHRHQEQTLPDMRQSWSREKRCQSPDYFFGKYAPEIVPKLKTKTFF